MVTADNHLSFLDTLLVTEEELVTLDGRNWSPTESSFLGVVAVCTSENRDVHSLGTRSWRRSRSLFFQDGDFLLSFFQRGGQQAIACARRAFFSVRVICNTRTLCHTWHRGAT